MYDISCLRYIVISICDICNQKCTMCPHSIDEWSLSNTDIMTIDTVKKLKERLDEIHYKGIVSISGMGEPLLNPDIKEILDILSRDKEYTLHIVTNGICLLEKDNDLIYYLINKCDKISISIHDMKNYYDKFKEYKNLSNKIELRNHDINDSNSTIYATNRGGTLSRNSIRKRKCYYPYYEICIDCLGRYLLCAHDFNKKSLIKDYDIYNIGIDEYFLDKMKYRKEEMYTTDIQCFEPCIYCDCNGLMDGKEEYDKFVEHISKKEGSLWLNLLRKFLKI